MSARPKIKQNQGAIRPALQWIVPVPGIECGMTTPLRVVFDTNVALAIEVFADPRLLALSARWARGELIAIADDQTLAEFARVLRYPELRLDETAAAAASRQYGARCTIVPCASANENKLPRCRDPDDQKFLQLAQRAGADWLLTRDKALLALRKSVRFGIAAPESLPAGCWRVPA